MRTDLLIGRATALSIDFRSRPKSHISKLPRMTFPSTANIHVCPLKLVSEMIERTGARHLVSTIDAEFLPATPLAIAPGRHLRLEMHDIVEARLDAVPPAAEHVTELIDFARSWDRRDPLLVHCYAGISRSTAGAFIVLCALNPEAPEVAVARSLRRASPTASPNRLFIALADTALGRGGRMIAAVNAMGQCQAAPEYIPFEIASSLVHVDTESS